MKFLLILGVILFVASSCLGATWRVPSQFEYLQQAIVEADPGDTILVAPGTYYPEAHDGDLIVSVIGHDKDGLVLISEAGEESTLLEGWISLQNVDGINIKGFSISDRIANTFCTNHTISHCTVNGGIDFGIFLHWCEGILLANLNISGSGDNGIEVEHSPDVIISDCVLYGHSASGIIVVNSLATILNCVLADNIRHGLESYGSVTIDGNTIADNGQAGIRLCTGTATIEHNNVVSNGYAGVTVDYGNNPVIMCNNVWGNSNFANGNYVGFITDQTGYNGNISVDPLFCDPDHGDYSVDAGSAVLTQACGVIGALPDPGCSTQTATAMKSWGAIKEMYR